MGPPLGHHFVVASLFWPTCVPLVMPPNKPIEPSNRCICRWLWSAARRASSPSVLELPPCATPFSVRNRRLARLTETQLCGGGGGGLLPAAKAAAATRDAPAGCVRQLSLHREIISTKNCTRLNGYPGSKCTDAYPESYTNTLCKDASEETCK